MPSLLTLTVLLLAAPEVGAAVPAPFTPARFREHVAYLAADELAGRAVGSAGSTKAIDYIVRHLKEYGATGLGPGGTWLQSFPHATMVSAKPENSLAVLDGLGFKLGRDFAPALESPDAECQAEMVFVGYGLTAPKVQYDDFAGVDLQGKVAVILAGASKGLADAGAYASLGQKWRECEGRGAVAILAVQPKQPSALKTDGQVPAGNQARRIPCILMERDAAGKLFAKTDGGADGLTALESALNQGDKPKPQSRPLQRKIRLRVRLDHTPLVGRNILAVVAGRGELAKEAILVSTHHDHLGTDPERMKAGQDGIFNGADDNASGCSALLLLAQALHSDRNQLPASYRAVIFASFDAEEAGLAGSRYYVRQPLWPLERTAANLNFDMIGRLNRGKLVAMDSESSAFLSERILALAPECGLTVETRLNGARRSDHVNFLDRAIPAVHFNTGLHADYHQVTDEVERIDSEGGARIAWLAYRLLRETMELPGRLRYRQPSATFDVQAILQFVFKLGIIPEQNAQSGRSALIRFVVPGSQAAKHGLQSGDEIIGANGVMFTSIIDAAIIFGQLRLDQGLRLTLRRQGKALEVELPAEAFKDFAGPTARPLGKEQFDVLFRYKPAATVKSVTLAGTFNDWNAKAQPLEGPDKNGYFATRIAFKAGTYEYKFVLDGKTWVADPENFRTTGPSANSVLTLGGSR
jgi:hypothetical protein